MTDTDRRHAVTRARWPLAVGLALSGIALLAMGGWWGGAIGGAQLGVAAVLAASRAAGPLAAALLSLIPAPLAAARHWTARLPGGCGCARLAHPAPGLVSLTGLVVALDVSLLGIIVWLAAANGSQKMGKYPP